MARPSTKTLATLAQAAIEAGHPVVKDTPNLSDTLNTESTKIDRPSEMLSSAVAEIAEREQLDADSVAHHVQRLTGGVPVREFEKALHTLASFLALPVKRIDPRTGEIVTFDMGRSEVEQLLNACATRRPSC
jgi:hypothetical protein